MTRFGYCSVANGGCKAPAAIQAGCGGPVGDEAEDRVGVCRLCGDEVCTGKNCSRRIGSKRGPGGRFRVCFNCEAEAAARVAPRTAAP